MAPDFPDLMFNLGNMHYLSEHWRKAIDYFEGASGVAVDGAGNVFVSESGNCRVSWWQMR